jgi:hypothetical protein
LNIYNKSFGNTIKTTDLQGTDQIVVKIARYIGVERFDHGKPADCLLRNKLDILPNLTEITLANFEKLFELINKTMGN